jgi:phosphoribosylpyrophosphate synthetase
MTTLNLASRENSSVEYHIFKFPDGQQAIALSEDLGFSKDDSVTIISRLNSFLDLELIISANQALKDCGAKEIHLFVPYFLGARSDRKFTKITIGENLRTYFSPNYLKRIICPLINLQKQ